ncbi:histone H1.01-like [Tiliqua scincoides]|uniref:histone H1.01-like n=1 Tax=Tiliqua scincoides TaxID=71010 RepID=UPI003461CAC1
MSETAPEAPAAPAKVPAKKPRRPAGAPKPRRAAGPSVTELLTKAVAASRERSGVSLAALKKALAAAGYDVERNNGRIKLGLRSLVSRGTLLQTRGTGASGSFRLNRKQEGGERTASRAAPRASRPTKAPARKPRTPAKKSPKKAPRKPAKKSPKKPAKSPRKAQPKAKAKKAARTPKAVKPKAKPRTPKAKAAKPRKTAPKKK